MILSILRSVYQMVKKKNCCFSLTQDLSRQWATLCKKQKGNCRSLSMLNYALRRKQI